MPSAKNDFTTIENEVIKLKIANKGGYIAEATLKNFEKFKKGSGQLVELIKNNNANLNIVLQTNDNRTLNTKAYFNQNRSGSSVVYEVKVRSKFIFGI